MKHKDFVWFAIILISLYSCSMNKRPLGIYYSRDRRIKIELLDTIFKYSQSFSFRYEHSEGTWRLVNKNTIEFNSFRKEMEIPWIVVNNNDSLESKNFLSLNISLDSNLLNYYHCSIYVNDSLFHRNNLDSLNNLELPGNLRSLYLTLQTDDRIPSRFLNVLSTDMYRPLSSSGNHVKASLVYNDSLFNYKVFNGARAKISRRKLKLNSLADLNYLELEKNQHK